MQVIPFLHNMQSHTLTCNTAEHSLGQHFRLKEDDGLFFLAFLG
jgi:hypothetical protein